MILIKYESKKYYTHSHKCHIFFITYSNYVYGYVYVVCLEFKTYSLFRVKYNYHVVYMFISVKNIFNIN